ncbi:MAG: glucosyl-3-phosphoglycerate synthase [Candidatus Woesearchaeota archaeon]|mgnify:CR=1 FL=1|jgi:glucosyl-3-phosphoglycerate synthase|nr:glucosyl-3-phosphoglycerate synthase [Candidatus Woesearchaeota archaeon]
MNVPEWFEKYRFKASSFSNIKRLVELKNKQKQVISLIIPTLNEADTIGKVISVLKSNLMDKHGLIDEIIVMDSGSTDETLDIAKKHGVIAIAASEVLKKQGDFRGKGENLWKALHVAKGTIVCWVDADIKNIHPRFVYGLVGPLLTNDKLKFVKPFYKRPIKIGDKLESLGGGRVTELLIRPLFNMYFPRLAGFIQPLSGEGAGRRTAFEKIPYFTGYGVETAMLIDMRKKFGLRAMAQVDLLRRVHRNQSLASLSRMAFAILGVFAKRANTLGKLIHVGSIKTIYKIITTDKESRYYLKHMKIIDKQRPPIITIPEYRRKFKKNPSWMAL